MIRNVLIICILITPLAIAGVITSKVSELESTDKYYKNLFLGEKKIGNYSGATDARTIFNENSGKLSFLDEQFHSHYLNSQTQEDAIDLYHFWFKKVVEKSTCPDMALGENIDYIRYLYRLLSISYLFETLKVNNKISSSLKKETTDENVCSISFDEVFGKCQPQSDDMKKFHERVNAKFANDISKIAITSFNKGETAKWLENFQRSNSLTSDPVYSQLHDWCHQNKKNCKSLSMNEIKKALGAICNGHKTLIQNICGEKDSLFGISYIDKANEVIQSSNAFNMINQAGMGEDCLRRYTKIFSPQEIRYDSLNRQFPLIYSHLIRTNSRYMQGELFLPGALKEFDVKGLGDFLTALKPPKTEVVVKTLPKPKPKVKVVVAPKPKEVVKPEAVVMVIPPPPVVKISEFENALAEFEGKKLASLSINMDRFRDDFEFTQQMIADLAAPIKKFQTRSALSDMKAYDNLGSAEAPVGLIFLKYLIDSENHQGLYNIITILGDKFYVNNDIEKKDKSVLIELRNDSSTGNRWQIILIKSK